MGFSVSRVGKKYYYRRRVPADLVDKFPSAEIKKSLKTDNPKQARQLASAYDYQTSKLFTEVRTGMIDPQLEKYIIAQHLKAGLERIEADLYDKKISAVVSPPLDSATAKELDHLQSSRNKVDLVRGWTPDAQGVAKKLEYLQYRLDDLQEQLSTKTPDKNMLELTDTLVDAAEIKKLSKPGRKSLALQLLTSEIKLTQAEQLITEGKPYLYSVLQSEAQAALKKPYIDLKSVLLEYLETYLSENAGLHEKTLDSAKIQCIALLEIIGDVSIDVFNTHEALIHLKKALRIYPVNRSKRYGNTPLKKIRDCTEFLHPVTANHFIGRAASVVDFAIARHKVATANIYRSKGARFKEPEAPEEQRKAYDADDLERLTEALCTQPLSGRESDPKLERFWVIMVALFTGLRLANIIELKKEQIKRVSVKDKEFWLIDVKKGKTRATVRPVAIPDALESLGFIEWVGTLKRDKLFTDDPKSFSRWYNRNEIRPDGVKILGFEAKHVTTDPKKCLYSLRHVFAGAVAEISDNFKVVSDLMGHSTDKNTSARYAKITKAARLKDTADLMQIEGLDLERLRLRALELFPALACQPE